MFKSTKITKEVKKKLLTWSYHVGCRDNFTCKICGLDQEETLINSHHIKHPRQFYPNLTFKVSNGITLCETCHKIYHENYLGSTKLPGTITSLKYFANLYIFLLLILVDMTFGYAWCNKIKALQ